MVGRNVKRLRLWGLLILCLLPQPTGLLIQPVAARSPADLIGLKASTINATIGEHTLLVGGDIILAVQGIELREDGKSRQQILRELSALEPGALITVKVLRSGRTTELRTLKLP